MHFYKPQKKYLYWNIVCISCIAILFSCFSIKFVPFHTVKWAIPILVAFISIWAIFLLSQDYRNGLTIHDKGIRAVSRGSRFDISYQDIYSITYHGFAGFPLWDCLVLKCGNNRKIYIDAAAYKDYSAIWEQIIKYAKAEKPNLIIDASVYKRLER